MSIKNLEGYKAWIAPSFEANRPLEVKEWVACERGRDHIFIPASSLLWLGLLHDGIVMALCLWVMFPGGTMSPVSLGLERLSWEISAFPGPFGGQALGIRYHISLCYIPPLFWEKHNYTKGSFYYLFIVRICSFRADDGLIPCILVFYLTLEELTLSELLHQTNEARRRRLDLRLDFPIDWGVLILVHSASITPNLPCECHLIISAFSSSMTCSNQAIS